MVFSGPTQILTGAYFDQYNSVQFYPNNTLISDPNMVQSLNWWPVNTSYQSG